MNYSIIDKIAIRLWKIYCRVFDVYNDPDASVINCTVYCWQDVVNNLKILRSQKKFWKQWEKDRLQYERQNKP